MGKKKYSIVGMYIDLKSRKKEQVNNSIYESITFKSILSRGEKRMKKIKYEKVT